MIGKLLVLFFMTLTIQSCNTTPPARYFNRPEFTECISNGDGTSYCNGELVDNINHTTIAPEETEVMRDYFEDKELRLYKCLEFNDCH